MNKTFFYIASMALVSSYSNHLVSAGVLNEAFGLERFGVLRVDIETGRASRFINQITGSRIEVNSEGIFVISDGGSVAQYDLDTGEQIAVVGPSNLFIMTPSDFEIDANGDFIVASEFRFDRITRDGSVSNLFGDFNVRHGSGREIEIAVDGTIIANAVDGPVRNGLLVLHPGAETPERISHGEFISLAVHPSGDLIAVHEPGATEAIVRVDLETGEISPTLAPFTLRNIEVDAIGRILKNNLAGW